MFNEDGAKIFSEMHGSGGFSGCGRWESASVMRLKLNVYRVGMVIRDFEFFRKKMTRKCQEPMFYGGLKGMKKGLNRRKQRKRRGKYPRGE
jgi:hypothetical protein